MSKERKIGRYLYQLCQLSNVTPRLTRLATGIKALNGADLGDPANEPQIMAFTMAGMPFKEKEHAEAASILQVEEMKPKEEESTAGQFIILPIFVIMDESTWKDYDEQYEKIDDPEGSGEKGAS